MRRWGIVITLTYGILLIALFLPALGGEWMWAALLIGAQAVLFMRVDRSWRRLRPRTHVAVTATAMAAATSLLFFGFVLAPLAVIYGDMDWPAGLNDVVFSNLIAIWLGLWGFWTVVFVLYYRRVPARMANLIQWLLTGSVLELLIAVPAHVIVRRRHDCSAPVLTGFGIITGTAVMLMCVGPGVIALYQQRRQRYRAAVPTASDRAARC